MKPVIRTPYFEIGTKNYIYGDKVLEYALAADAAAEKLAEHTKHLIVLAPYMDTLRPGRGMADILPEALKAAGAQGVVINHCEKPMSLPQMKATIDRARELDFLVFACADTLDEHRAFWWMRVNAIEIDEQGTLEFVLPAQTVSAIQQWTGLIAVANASQAVK